MKRKKTPFEIEILASMMELGFTWESLSLIVNGKPNNGHNLNKQIKEKSIGACKVIKLCEVLNLDLGEMYKL